MMNILLPTDFSENSKNAAIYAVQFFKDVPCTLHLLHIIPASAEENAGGSIATSNGVREKFEKFLLELSLFKSDSQQHFTTTCKINYFIEAVREQVLEKGIDLILMGTKGSSNRAGAAIGKNTSDVMTKVKCPVLAISEKTVYKEHKEILFPTDYKIQYNTKMLETLLNLSSLSRAQVNILELFNSENEPSEEQLANRVFLQNSFSPKIPMLQTYYSSKVPDTARLFVKNKNVDMIVMVAKNLNICQQLLKNQKNNQIPIINQLPLLVLHG